MKQLALCVISFGLVACGSDGSDGDGTMDTPLQCSDFAYCSTYDVKSYIAPVPAPAGGSISDGLYRLAWTVDPPEAGIDPGTDYADAFRIDGEHFVFGDYGGRGTLSIAGTQITLHNIAHCANGEEVGTPDPVRTYEFTATTDQISLYSTTTSGGTSWLSQSVYI
ncbi:MAG: hypothetical protein AB7O24_32120, partial [Kofleriaceae bacterium]